MEEIIYKTCTKCGLSKLTTDFNKKCTSSDGLHSNCKLCRSEARYKNSAAIAAQKKAWADKNSTHVKEKAKEMYESNKECILKRRAEHYTENSDRIKANVAEYQRQNVEMCRIWRRNSYRRNAIKNRHKDCAYSARKRALKKRATPSWGSDEIEILSLYERAQELTKETGKSHHVDHIVPLVSDFVCGLHCVYNLQVLLGSENISKGNRIWPNMWIKD